MPVRKLPSGRWRARYRGPDGKERGATYDLKRDALKWEREQRARLQRGEWVDPTDRTTLREWCERWRQAQRHRPGTAALYERLLRLHVYPRLGDRRLSSLTPLDASAFLAGLDAGALSPATRRQVQAVLRTALRAAVAQRLLPESPFRAERLPAVPRAAVAVLEPEQVELLAEAVPLRYRALVVLAWQTGLRQGELLGLTRDRLDPVLRDVRVDRQLVYVPGSPPALGPLKTDRHGNRSGVRTVPLSERARVELAEHLRAFPPGLDGLVFTRSSGDPVLRTSFHGGVWRPALLAAGMPRETHFHHLRHTFASSLLAAGVDVVTVAELLGHATPAETQRTYAHVMPSARERARSALERAFRSVDQALENSPYSAGDQRVAGGHWGGEHLQCAALGGPNG